MTGISHGKFRAQQTDRGKMNDDDKLIPVRPPTPVGEAGGIVDESKVTLALYADNLDPEEVSRLLRATPTDSHRRGERRSERSRPYKQGAWLLTVAGVAPTGPDQLIHTLLERFPAAPEFWAKLRGEYIVKLMVAVFQESWNRGFDLMPETVALVARTGALVEFDLYCDGEGESGESE